MRWLKQRIIFWILVCAEKVDKKIITFWNTSDETVNNKGSDT